MTSADNNNCENTADPSTWLLRRLRLKQDSTGLWLRYILGLGGVAAFAVIIGLFAPNILSTAWALKENRLGSKLFSFLIYEAAVILYCIGIAATSLLALVTILYRTNLTWALLTFYCLFSIIYVGNTTVSLYLWPESAPQRLGENTNALATGSRSAGQVLKNNNPVRTPTTWWEWRRRLINHGYPIVSFMGGTYVAAILLRMRNKWFLTCNCSDSRGFTAYQKLSFTLACFILFVFGGLVFGSFARGSNGTLHGMLFAIEGAVSTFITFLCLRKLLGVQSTKLSTGSTLAFFIILFIVSFVLWIFFFNGFPLSSIHSSPFSLGSSLLIIVGTIALGCAWLRGCGWRIRQE